MKILIILNIHYILVTANSSLHSVINVEIDLQSVTQAREKLPVLADRKL